MAGFKHVFLFVFLSCLIYRASSISIEANSPRANGLHAGNGISTTPRFSWRLASTSRNDSQTAYQIQVANSASALSSPDMWDSGKVSSSSTSASYSRVTLVSRDIGWWRVRVWDANDTTSSWSSVTTFELGLLNSSDWNATWIANTNYVRGINSLPIFAKVFNVTCSVTKARLYLLGLGQHAAMINGVAVSDAVLEPGYSTVASTLFYSSYNISGLISKGTNVLGVELGKGEYDPEPGLWGRYMKYTKAAQQLMLISQLEYTCSTGEIVHIGSDGSWLTTVDGPRIESSWYGGEEYDARKIFANYSMESGNRAGWVTANTTTGPLGKLVGTSSPPLKVVQTMTAADLTQVGTQWVFDFGVNFAGWYTFTMDGTGLAGTRIVFYPGEKLTSAGLADQSTTGSPIFDAYTIAGNSFESYRPKFMYHGFRYLHVNVTWTPLATNMTGQVIRSNTDGVGSTSTSNSLFNSIHKIIDRAIQSNLYSVLTDCPYREKLGWLEESHLVLDPVARGYDLQAYGYAFVQNMGDTQTSTGLVPDISPEFVVFSGGFRDDPNWGNTMILMPYIHYRYYGDIDLLSKYYTNMTAYLSYLTTSKASNYLLSYGLGDWVTTDSSTPVGVTATFGYQQAAAGLAVIAAGLGKTSDAATYETLNTNIKNAFHTKYFNTTSNATYSSGSQACNAIALDMGAVPAEYEAAVLQTLVDSLVRNGYHMTVGEIALPSLFRVLRAYNRNDIIYNMMSLTTSVSYGYQVTHGATSLWEQWSGSGSSGSSLNHFMLGYGDNWLLELSGLAQSNNSIGWQTIDYNPIVVGDLTSASSSYRTPRGTASASWSLSGTALNYVITVPVGATGLVYLNQSTITESSKSITVGSNGILGSSTSANITTIMVDGFKANWEQQLRTTEKAKAMFEAQGVDFEEFWARIGGMQGMPGMDEM
ncbi:uncharacterized protein PAC_19918 [Phialocephala subalpina]|uniref:alpha-L-rhamnosidase n=1 Tax=Phialocephala subalpina TaxID=576137 RepID=A0A1L7XYB9_9HELO|nr:uncharacterized protein PAC_19918 [Phialocephala subalpina]